MKKSVKCEKCKFINKYMEFIENDDYDTTEVGIQIYCKKCGNPILIEEERFKE